MFFFRGHPCPLDRAQGFPNVIVWPAWPHEACENYDSLAQLGMLTCEDTTFAASSHKGPWSLGTFSLFPPRECHHSLKRLSFCSLVTLSSGATIGTCLKPPCPRGWTDGQPIIPNTNMSEVFVKASLCSLSMQNRPVNGGHPQTPPGPPRACTAKLESQAVRVALCIGL